MPQRITHEEWLAEGKRRFGENFFQWRFECPVCHHIATVSDFEAYKDSGATPDSARCECIGRYQGEKYKAFGDSMKAPLQPCDYAGYGLFKLSPLVVVLPDGTEIHSFGFAEASDAHPGL